MATHSSTLSWKIPWTEEPGRLQSMGSLRVGHDRVTSLSLFTFMHWRRKWQPTPVFLPGESQGWGSLVGCHLWGCAKLDMTEAAQQQQQGHNSCWGGSPFPCKLGTERVPASQAAVSPSRLPLTGAELPQAKKSCIYACKVTLVVSNSLRPCRLWPARILCQRGGSPGKNTGAYYPILVAMPFQSTLFPAALAANPPEYLVLPEPL